MVTKAQALCLLVVCLCALDVAEAIPFAKAMNAPQQQGLPIDVKSKNAFRSVPDPTVKSKDQNIKPQQPQKAVSAFATSALWTAKWNQKPAVSKTKFSAEIATTQQQQQQQQQQHDQQWVQHQEQIVVSPSVSPFPSLHIENGKMMLVAVCSAPSHVEQRAAIRRTWATVAQHLPPYDYDILFFVGQTLDDNMEKLLQSEMASKGDLVRVGTFESYHNLTLKTLDMVRYAYTHRYDVLLKVDDDTFVLLDNILYDVMAYNPDRTALYWGKFWGSDDRPVDRSKGSKYYVSREEYAPDTYPNYPDGPCYAVGKELLKWIVDHEASLRKYRLEDAAMGIWLNGAVTLPIVEQFGAAYLYQRECPEGNYYYYINPVTPSEMDDIMQRYANRLDICSGNFSLGICSDSVKGCLCSPSNNPCWDRPDFQFLTQIGASATTAEITTTKPTTEVQNEQAATPVVQTQQPQQEASKANEEKAPEGSSPLTAPSLPQTVAIVETKALN